MARPEAKAKTPLGQRLRDVRKALGDPSRDDLGKLFGVSKDSVALYERGIVEPNSQILSIYKTHYGVSLDWLITGAGEMFGEATETLHVSGGFLNRQRLEAAIEAVFEGLEDHRPTPDMMAKIILAAYDMLKEEKNKDNVIQLVRSRAA